MEKNGMGTLLSVIFLILGTTFLPEPIDAAPQDYKSRSERSPSPDPRCPNCPKDCPESLSGGLPEPESVVEQYSSMSKPSYSPPSYNAVQQQYSAQQPSPYAAPVQPPSPLYSVAQPPSRPPPPSYAAPPQDAYAHQPAAAYPSPPARPAYSVPSPSYGLPPPPAHPAYGAPPPSYGLPPPPAQPAYGAPPPPPPPAFYAAPPPPQPPPASYNPPPPATPSPPASYNPPPPSPPASYNSQPPASYNLSPPRTSYDQSPPSRPPPPATEKPFKITLSRTSTSPPTKSPYPNKLPPPPAIPNEPPLSDKPCFKQPPPPPPKPENCNSLPMPRYNHLTNPWAQYRNFGYNPYAPSPYQPNYLNARPTYGYSCDDFDEDDEEEPVFSKYNRRSSDNRYYRHSGHHQDHFIDPLNSPTSMYKNYRPYERDEGRSVFSDEFGSEESTSSSKDQPRERLYVVYRADAIKDKIPSSLSPVINLSEDPSSMSDREIESMIRRAIEVSRLQRSHQDNVLYSRADPRYQYQHVSQQLDIAEQPEFKSLAQQQYDSQYPLGQYQMSPVQMMDNEGQYVVREEGDEVNNPGWDQTKWTAVPAMSGDFDNPENVYAANVGVSNGESVVPTEIQPAVAVAAAVVPPIEVGEEVQNPEEILQPESRLEKDIGESPSEVKENKTEEVDLIEDMETPQTVTEASSFDRHADTTTDDRM